MSTPITSQEPVPGPAPVDRGLRSTQGIRWLLLAGGLVVAVSVIRLVAAEWGMLSAAARFLTLVAGALAVFAAGDFTRRRLCLPVAGSALLFLGTALVPLLAWGAAYLELLDAQFGWPSLIFGLGALAAAADRTLRGVLAYRGGAYTVASSIFLVALPVLPYLESRWSGGAEIFFLLAAGALGLLLRGAGRHVNRFFFHRDRLSGVERPVHWLPFALLVLLYGAGMSLLAAFSTHLAVPLAFVAVALIDAGEEYYRALIRATGEKPDSWPRRSLALLALGFAALAAAPATAILDAGSHSLAVVASIAASRLLAWAWRYRDATAHTCGLLAGIVAYHAFPVLIPEAVRKLFEHVILALGLDPRSLGAVSFGDLGMVAALLALAWLYPLVPLRDGSRHQLTPAMRRAHALITGACASLLLLVSLTDPAASRLVAPVATVLLAAGLFILRWKALIPVLYQALATSALAWAWSPALSGAISAGATSAGALVSARSALYLGVVHLVFLGAGLAILRRRDEAPPAIVTRLMTWPPIAVAFALLGRALVLADNHWGIAGVLMLVAAETFLLSALVLRRGWPLVATSLALVCGAHCLAVPVSGTTTVALSIVSQGLMASFWLLANGLEGRGGALAGAFRQSSHVGFVVCAELGLLWLVVALVGDTGVGVEAFHLALLAGLLIAGELRAAARETAGEVRWRLEAGLALAVVWVPLQTTVAAGMRLTAAAAGWLALAVMARAGAEVLARRSRSNLSHLAPPFMAVAWISGALAGAMAIWTTLNTAGSPWSPILPGFLASLFFTFMAIDGTGHGGRPTERHPEGGRKLPALLATSLFATCCAVLLLRLETWGPELHCLGPGLALLGLSGLLRHELDQCWHRRLFTAGAALLYAMPVLGLLEELSWGWQIVLLLLAVAFGAASFRLRSRSLLIVSTAALIIDLACFLIKLRQTAPLLVWVAGIVFGLGLMAVAALLEHRREVLLQHIRIWGLELRSWA